MCNPGAHGQGRESCGGEERGTCTQGNVCECKKGWTGPHCLASAGFDDIVWDEPDTIRDVGFVPPSFVPTGLMVGLVALVIIFFASVQWRKHMEGWSPIPDVQNKYR